MSDVFATATVRVEPSLTRFVTDLDTELKKAMAKVKPPVIRVKPGLTVNFVGDLRKQVNAAILQAQKGIKPIRVKALIEPIGVSGKAIPGGGGGGGGAAGSATRTSSTLTALRRSQELVATAQLNLNRAFDKTLPIEEQVAAVTKVNTSLTEAQAAAERTLIKAIVDKDAALQRSARKQSSAIADFQRTFASRAKEVVDDAAPRAQPTLASKAILTTSHAQGRIEENIRTTVTGLREQSAAFAQAGKGAQSLTKHQEVLAASSATLKNANKGVTLALAQEDEGLIRTARLTQSLAQSQVNASKAAVTAARQAAKENAKSARSSEQLTRGGQASLLSIAGIRGATLAASRSFLVGAAAITVFAKAVKSFADLNRNLDVFQATAGATAAEMERVTDAAIALGADLTLPGVSAGDAAGAMVELAKAGLSVEDSISAARGVLELATAAAIDNAAATQLVANALNAFQLSGREAIVVADTFANAANAAQGSIADIGTAFQQAAAAGRQVGLSFQDTSVFLTILAKNGLRGSDAGTSLRTALIRLVNPSKEAAAKFKDLGIQVRDAAGNLRPDVFLQIADATSRLSPAARDAAIALIGGQDAFRAITILGRQSVTQFIAMRRALREEGSAAKLAEARTRGLHGAMDGLASVLETVGTQLGGAVGPGLATFVRNASAGINALAASDDVAKTLNETLTAAGQGFNLIGSAATAAAGPVLFLSRALLSITNTIGVSEILAGVAAYKLLGGAAARLGPLFGVAQKGVFGFGVAQRASILTTKGLRAALIGAASSFNVYLIAAAAVTAGLVFLLTREGAVEKATRKLTEATKALASAQDQAKTSARAAGDASLGVNASQLAVLNAQRAANQARRALANSNAGAGTVERKRIELQLAVALDDVKAAQQRYNDAVRDSKELQEVATQASRNAADALEAETLAIARVVAVQAAQGQLGSRGRSAQDKNSRAVDAVTKALEKQAEAARKEGTVESIHLAQRIELLAGVAGALNKIPTQKVIEIAIESDNLKIATQAIIQEFGVTGVKARQALLDAISGVNVATLASSFKKLLKDLSNLIQPDANQVGEELASALIAGAEHGIGQAKPRLQAAIADAFNIRGPGRLSGLQEGAVDLEIAGASDSAILANLRQQEAEARRRLANAQAGGRAGKVAQETIRRRKNELAAIIREIRSLSKSMASDAKTAAEDVARDQAEATQAFIDGFDPRRQTLENRVTDASFTPSLQDDIKRNQILRQFFIKRIELIRARIRSMHLHGDALKAALAAIRGFTQDIFNTKNEIDKLVKQQADARFDLLISKADLRIRIAEANTREGDDNTAAILKARRRKLAIINKEIHRLEDQGKKNTLAWLELKAQQAEERKAIDELTQEIKDKNNANAEMQFQFLQTQAGFAANLLGNLIPTGFGSGTVGGSTSGGTSGAPVIPPLLPPGVGGGGRFPGALLPQEHGRGGGPSPAEDLRRTTVTVAGGPTRGGQVSQTQLLHQIRHLLQLIYKGTGHPEAKHRQRRNITDMDLADHH